RPDRRIASRSSRPLLLDPATQPVAHGKRHDNAPSTGMMAPLTYEARSDARKQASSATSSGRPARPIAGLVASSGYISAARPLMPSGERMTPGHTQLARMPTSPYSMAAFLVTATTPAFAAQ